MPDLPLASHLSLERERVTGLAFASVDVPSKIGRPGSPDVEMVVLVYLKAEAALIASR